MVMAKDDLNGMREKLYGSIIEGFVTYLARCLSRNAKNNVEMQSRILNDLCCILERLKSENRDAANDGRNDNDVQMKDNTQTNAPKTLSTSIIKHIRRSIGEIDSNLLEEVKTKHCDRLSFLSSLQYLL